MYTVCVVEGGGEYVCGCVFTHVIKCGSLTLQLFLADSVVLFKLIRSCIGYYLLMLVC